MKEERIALLIARKIAKEASAEELDELQLLLQANPEDAFTYESLNALKSEVKYGDEDLAAPQLWAEKSWDKLAAAMEEETVIVPMRSRKRWYGAAAIALLIAAGGAYFYLSGSSGNASSTLADSNKILMEKGTRSSIQLPDGSIVWMNSGSKLSYGDAFNKGDRSVFLEGEAYFDIKKDEQHPFIIHTKKMDILVLGTAFNVKAYEEDEKTETALLSGKISVKIKGNNNARDIILLPRQKLIVDNDVDREPDLLNTTAIQVVPLECNGDNKKCDEVSWIYNRLVFKHQAFKDLARRMERWYNVTIYFEDAELEKETLSGIFEGENITEALEALQLSTTFSFRHEGSNIHLRRTKP